MTKPTADTLESEKDKLLRNNIPMTECIRYLGRICRGHPKADIITLLIGQCNSYRTYPNMGPKILETIDAIERC